MSIKFDEQGNPVIPPEPKPRMTFWGPRIEPQRIGYGSAALLAKQKAEKQRLENESLRLTTEQAIKALSRK